MFPNYWPYVIVMAVVTYLVRVVPLTLMRKEITNEFFLSFLYYVPYITLAVMTFPAIIESTQTPLSGLLALIAGLIAAWFGASLFQVASLCCVVVLIAEFVIQ